MNKAQHQPEPTIPGRTVALNYFSVVFLASGFLGSMLLANRLTEIALYFGLWLYLLPPLACRLTLFFAGSRPTGFVSQHSSTHTLWWWLFQLQLPFNRFPFLEELLRIVPGVYALWLNLWGARVSPFSFWSPGVIVMDRYHLEVGKGVILGTQAFISPHVLKKMEDGTIGLLIDSVVIEEGALIGARAVISPGCHIHQQQTVAINTILRPYTMLKDGGKTLIREKSEFDTLDQ